MDNSTNYVSFIRKIYSQDKSESNHLALMEMFRIFEYSEKCGFNTELTYDTMTALAGFYPEVMDKLAKYPKTKREKFFESADTLNYLAARMFDVLRLYGKRIGNHAKKASFSSEEWCDPKSLIEWVWTDEYIIAGETILYLEATECDGIVRIPSVLAGRYISRLGQGSLRFRNDSIEKVVIASGISMVGAQPELRRAAVLEFPQSVEKIEIPQDILGSTKVFLRLVDNWTAQAERFKTDAKYRTTDGGYLLSYSFLSNEDDVFPETALYRCKADKDSYDLYYKLQTGSEWNIEGKGQHTSILAGDFSKAVALYRVDGSKPSVDIDRISQLVAENMCGKAQAGFSVGWASICTMYGVLYEHDDGLVMQMLIGHGFRYDAETVDVLYKGKKYEIFRAYDTVKATEDSMALSMVDENGFKITDEALRRFYLRRCRLLKMLA